MGGGNRSRKPSGNILPCRFVTLQTDNTVIASSAGDSVWGIADKYTRNYPLAGYGGDDPAYIGIAGDPAINIFGPGDDACLIQLGGTVTIGANLIPSTAGVAIASTTDGDKIGAVAEEAGVSGDLIRCKPGRWDRGS